MTNTLNSGMNNRRIISARSRRMRAIGLAAILTGGSLFDACSAHWHYAISNGGKDFLSQLLNPTNFLTGTTSTGTSTGSLFGP